MVQKGFLVSNEKEIVEKSWIPDVELRPFGEPLPMVDIPGT
jgi:hypothetical protein